MKLICFNKHILITLVILYLATAYGSHSIEVSTTEKLPTEENESLKIIKSELKTFNSRLWSLESKIAKMEAKETDPTSCQEVMNKGNTESGVYVIKPKIAPQPFPVFCDMKTRGGGWTPFVVRNSGNEDFYLGWSYYKNGFGDLNKEFWLGLDNIHYITESEVNELLVQMTDWDGIPAFAYYDHFVVGNENSNYRLKAVGEYSGTAGDGMTNYAGRMFSTKDRDNDLLNGDSCADYGNGSWWYSSCSNSNPTGIYVKHATYSAPEYRIVYWYRFRGPKYSLKTMKLMLRPRRKR